MPSKPDTGRYLAQLRAEAGLKQNELARRVTWSPAVLSRIEAGERPVSSDEIESILDAIGTDQAKEFKMTHNREWREIERPPLGHPDESLLWETDRALHDIKSLRNNPDIRNSFAKRLEEIEDGLRRVADPVSSTEHAIAFVGDIGVGKTTSICHGLGLEIRNDRRSRADAVLEVGGGGVTLCEVHITQGPGYGIRIEPMTEPDIKREVQEFANLKKNPPKANQDNEEPIGTSKEIERAIRNMSGLTIRRRRVQGADGKTRRVREDPVRELADDSTDTDALVVEILAKMNLPNRTRRDLWYTPTESIGDPLAWLSENFRLLNNGRHLGFSIPKRIEIVVPDPVLDHKSLSLQVIDTKGIDDTAQRGDIENLFDEMNSVSVLCSPFNSVPSPSVQQLLSRTRDGGYQHIEYKTAILGLPKHGEALAVKDDDGTPAEDVEDGYEMKREQAETKLASLGVPDVRVEFFNAHEDDPARLRSFILDLIDRLRRRNSTELEQAIEDARALVGNYEQEQTLEIQRQAARRLDTWRQNNRALDFSWIPSIEDSLMDSMERAHASTLRASVRREGDWHNLDYDHELQYGARIAAVRVVSSKLESLYNIADNLLQDPEFEDAYGLIRQVRRVMDTGVAKLYAKCALSGATHYKRMELDSSLWSKSDSEWGSGPGYKGRVAKHHRDWFDEHDQSSIQDRINKEWTETLDRVLEILDDALPDPTAAG